MVRTKFSEMTLPPQFHWVLSLESYPIAAMCGNSLGATCDLPPLIGCFNLEAQSRFLPLCVWRAYLEHTVVYDSFVERVYGEKFCTVLILLIKFLF